MLKEYSDRIRVDAGITPIPLSERTIPTLEIGKKYFVSFGGIYVYGGTLTKIINEYGYTEVGIEFSVKTKKKIRNSKGQVVQNPTSSHILRADSIGETPIMAAIQASVFY